MGMKSEEEFGREPESGNTGVVDENTHKASRCFNLFPSAFYRREVSSSPGMSSSLSLDSHSAKLCHVIMYASQSPARRLCVNNAGSNNYTCIDASEWSG